MKLIKMKALRKWAGFKKGEIFTTKKSNRSKIEGAKKGVFLEYVDLKEDSIY